ncbi:hypothetical protein ACFWXH_15310 [Mesorhizobium sp. NPDC059054]|uniref:hypothetical protein n=1 Tax=unclassified Mesorhizobium TaxID=325217 RepID=UPI0006C7744D|nr:hypothetical protein [Mesorhizobium sp. 1M-11]
MSTFEIYHSRHNPHHYVAVEAGDQRENAKGVRDSQNLKFLTNVADDGEPRIAFDPKLARSRIARDGFYAFAVTIEIREHPE